MPFVRPDHGRSRIDISPPADAADGDFPAGFAGVSVHQPDLPSAGPRPDPGVFRTDFLRRADAGRHFGAAGSQSSGKRVDEARLQRIPSPSMDFVRAAGPSWAAPFAE